MAATVQNGSTVRSRASEITKFIVSSTAAFSCCCAGTFVAVKLSPTIPVSIYTTVAIDIACVLLTVIIYHITSHRSRPKTIVPVDFTPIQQDNENTQSVTKVAWASSAVLNTNRQVGPVPFAHQLISVLVVRLPAIQQAVTETCLEELDGQFTAVVLGCIRRNQGVVQSFGGGVVVASWNAFAGSNSNAGPPSAAHEQCACSAAIEIREKLTATRDTDLQTVHMAVTRGLFSVGETDTHEGDRTPVIIGPYLSVAFRLARLNSLLNTSILVTDAVRDAVKDQFTFQIAEQVKFEDIPALATTKIGVYELFGPTTEVAEDYGYVKAFDAYVMNDNTLALTILQQPPEPPAKLRPQQERSRDRLVSWAKTGSRLFETRVYGGWITHDKVENDASEGVVPSPLRRREQSSFYQGLLPCASKSTIEPAEALRQQYEFFHNKGDEGEDDNAKRSDRTADSKTSTSAAMDDGIDDTQSNATDALDDFGDENELPTAAMPATAGCFYDIEGQQWLRGSTVLGRGGFGVVYQGMNPLGMMVAIKAHSLDEDRMHSGLSDVLREIGMLSKFNHRNIVRYFGSNFVGSELLIVMEYVPCGSLAEAIAAFSPMPTTTSARYASDILRGLAFLHSNNVIHRDIKPNNVLVSASGRCKLADFGLAGRLGEIPTEVVGTLFYMAPELLTGEATASSDMFSFGVTMYEMLVGHLPWKACQEHTNTVAKIYALHMSKHEYPPLSPAEHPAEAIALVEACLSRTPKERPTAHALQNHAFFGLARAQAKLTSNPPVAKSSPDMIGGWAANIQLPRDHPVTPLPPTSMALSLSTAVLVEPVAMETLQAYQSEASFNDLIHGSPLVGGEPHHTFSGSLQVPKRRKRRPSVKPPGKGPPGKSPADYVCG